MKPFRFWCQKVLPLAYDDSLSYYELLCKLVDYFNALNSDMQSIVSELTSLKNQFNTLDLTEYVNKRLDEMAQDGELQAILENYMGVPATIESQRIFRVRNLSDVSDAQCICTTSDKSAFWIGGHNLSDTTAVLRRVDIEGNVTKTISFTNETFEYFAQIKHLNSFGAMGGRIFAGTHDNKMVIINEETGALVGVRECPYVDTLSHYAPDLENNVLYVDGYSNGDYYSRTLMTYNILQNVFTVIAHFTLPSESMGTRTYLRQSAFFWNGFLYLCIARPNTLLCYNPKTGALVKEIVLPDGNGAYPYCELEGGAVIGGQVFLLTNMHSAAGSTYYRFGQVFKTNLGGMITPQSIRTYDYGYAYYMWVDGSSTASGNNPTGYSDRPFTDVEEASMVLNYLNNAFGCIFELSVKNITTPQTLFLVNVDCNIEGNGSKLGYLYLNNYTGGCRNFEIIGNSAITNDVRIEGGAPTLANITYSGNSDATGRWGIDGGHVWADGCTWAKLTLNKALFEVGTFTEASLNNPATITDSTMHIDRWLGIGKTITGSEHFTKKLPEQWRKAMVSQNTGSPIFVCCNAREASSPNRTVTAIGEIYITIGEAKNIASGVQETKAFSVPFVLNGQLCAVQYYAVFQTDGTLDISVASRVGISDSQTLGISSIHFG